MAEAQTVQRQAAAAPADFRKMLVSALVGAGVGLVAWGGGLLIARLIIEPAFCAGPTAAVCAVRDVTGFNIALVLATFAGLLTLVRARVYRPLLISLAAAVSLWSLVDLAVAGEVWPIRLAWTIGLSALAYAFFGLVAQLKSFVVALIISLVVAVGLRLIPNL